MILPSITCFALAMAVFFHLMVTVTVLPLGSWDSWIPAGGPAIAGTLPIAGKTSRGSPPGNCCWGEPPAETVMTAALAPLLRSPETVLFAAGNCCWTAMPIELAFTTAALAPPVNSGCRSRLAEGSAESERWKDGRGARFVMFHL
jgi:hypothetical protein